MDVQLVTACISAAAAVIQAIGAVAAIWVTVGIAKRAERNATDVQWARRTEIIQQVLAREEMVNSQLKTLQNQADDRRNKGYGPVFGPIAIPEAPALNSLIDRLFSQVQEPSLINVLGNVSRAVEPIGRHDVSYTEEEFWLRTSAYRRKIELAFSRLHAVIR